MWPDVNEYAVELAAELGVGAPLPAAVAVAAMRDPEYRRFLLRARRAPRLLSDLIDHPPDVGQVRDRSPRSVPEAVARPASDVLKRAAASFFTWSVSGFRVADDTTVARRLAECHACPLLGAAPDRVDYRIATIGVSDDRVCTACGCVVARKARLPHERCPSRSPRDPARSRWGDPYLPIAGTTERGVRNV